MMCQYYGNEKISTIKVNILFIGHPNPPIYTASYSALSLRLKIQLPTRTRTKKYATLHLHFNTHAGFNYGIEIEASFFSTLIVLLINVKK